MDVCAFGRWFSKTLVVPLVLASNGCCHSYPDCMTQASSVSHMQSSLNGLQTVRGVLHVRQLRYSARTLYPVFKIGHEDGDSEAWKPSHIGTTSPISPTSSFRFADSAADLHVNAPRGVLAFLLLPTACQVSLQITTAPALVLRIACHRCLEMLEPETSASSITSPSRCGSVVFEARQPAELAGRT